MIGIIFRFGTEVVEVRIDGETCLFRSSRFGSQYVTIEGLNLDKKGVIKEFPDLKDDLQWRPKAVIRFKQKISDLRTEDERMKYIIDDLKKFGYVPVHYQKTGHRPQKL